MKQKDLAERIYYFKDARTRIGSKHSAWASSASSDIVKILKETAASTFEGKAKVVVDEKLKRSVFLEIGDLSLAVEGYYMSRARLCFSVLFNGDINAYISVPYLKHQTLVFDQAFFDELDKIQVPLQSLDPRTLTESEVYILIVRFIEFMTEWQSVVEWPEQLK